MAVRILTYILGVLLTLYMSVLYKSTGLVFIFYTEIFVGSILFIINFIVFLSLNIKLKTRHVIERDSSINFEIIVHNKSIFHSGKISLTVTCLDPYTMKNKKVIIEQWCPGRREEKKLYSFKGKDGEILSGKYIISVNKISVDDYLGIFKLKKRIKAKNKIDCVVPIAVEKEGELADSSYEENDNMVNINVSDNGDLSYVREYRNGDRLNNIHWKLSSKSEKIYVKEFLTEDESYYYYIETKALNRKEIAEEFMMWILTATHVMEHGKSIIFVWYDSKQMCVKKAYISNEEEHYNALCEINIYEGKDKNTITDMDMLMKMEKRV